MNSSKMPPGGLYLLTPEEADSGRLRARVEPVLAAGAALLQLRCKDGDRARRRRHAEALLPACGALGVPLLINDDWRLAADLGLGAHLGEQDGELRDARAALGPGAILGASCYDDLERARTGGQVMATPLLPASGEATQVISRPQPTSVLPPQQDQPGEPG